MTQPANPLPGYVSLTPGAGYLKNIAPLATDPAHGLTQADLNSAAASARARIDAALAGRYDLSAWPAATPPIIARVAELLASADALDFKHARHDPGASDPFAASLRAEATFLLDALRAGRLRVVGIDGATQAPSAARPNVGRA